MIDRIKNLFNSLLSFPKRDAVAKKDNPLPSKKLYRKYYSYSSVDEIPEEVQENVMYHVGEEEFKWLLIFRCPCGCREIIQLNLLKEARPVWRVKIHNDGDVSLYPSVNRQVNCKSHFNITRNSVRWWEWLEDWD
jgi:hypothetical protein